jgi:hypothetical protein
VVFVELERGLAHGTDSIIAAGPGRMPGGRDRRRSATSSTGMHDDTEMTDTEMTDMELTDMDQMVTPGRHRPADLAPTLATP